MLRPESAKKKARIQGNDAIARLINAGRHCKDREHQELIMLDLPGKPKKARIMSDASDSAGLLVVRGSAL